MIDRRPALIASCHGVADVVTCVNFAREHGVTLSIKGGCHNISMRCTPAFPQQKTLQEREAGIHAAALRENEIGKLIERLSSECEKLSAELWEKRINHLAIERYDTSLLLQRHQSMGKNPSRNASWPPLVRAIVL